MMKAQLTARVNGPSPIGSATGCFARIGRATSAEARRDRQARPNAQR